MVWPLDEHRECRRLSGGQGMRKGNIISLVKQLEYISKRPEDKIPQLLQELIEELKGSRVERFSILYFDDCDREECPQCHTKAIKYWWLGKLYLYCRNCNLGIDKPFQIGGPPSDNKDKSG